jgi:hypothetical protein
MLEAPIPADEETRLALLKACRIIYTPSEQAFDDVARLAADLELFSAALTRPPQPLNEHLKEPVPSVVEEVLLKCLCKSRGERYPSMRVLSDVLRSAATAA